MALLESDIARDVTTADFTIHYNEAGPADAHPIILIHGGGPGATGWSNYSPNIEAIANAGFRVLALDLPGWGASSEVDFKTYEPLDALSQFMDALGIEKAAFVGNSMGGHTSIRMAIERPERVSHLITMGPPLQLKPFLFGATGPSEGIKIMYQGYTDFSVEHMERLVRIMVFDGERFAKPEIVKERAAAIAANPNHVANVAKKGIGAPIPKWAALDDLGKITAPTLLIHGRDDRVAPFEGTLWAVAHIPNSRAHIINRCGHWAQLEHADEFNRLVADFVANA